MSGASHAISVMASMPDACRAPSTTSYAPLIWLQPAEPPIRVASNVRRTWEPVGERCPFDPGRQKRATRGAPRRSRACRPARRRSTDRSRLPALRRRLPAAQAARTTVATASRPSVGIERMWVSPKGAGSCSGAHGARPMTRTRSGGFPAVRSLGGRPSGLDRLEPDRGDPVRRPSARAARGPWDEHDASRPGARHTRPGRRRPSSSAAIPRRRHRPSAAPAPVRRSAPGRQSQGRPRRGGRCDASSSTSSFLALAGPLGRHRAREHPGLRRCHTGSRCRGRRRRGRWRAGADRVVAVILAGHGDDGLGTRLGGPWLSSFWGVQPALRAGHVCVTAGVLPRTGQLTERSFGSIIHPSPE